MDLHEFQAKELLASFGISIPKGEVAESAAAAETAAAKIGSPRLVVKAQIKAGDRAKHGGVRFVASPREVRNEAGALCGTRLVTAQTPAAGLPVKWVYVEEAVDTAKSLYAAVTLDRASGRPVLLASAQGGDDIEALAESNPDIIQKIPLAIRAGGADGDFIGLAHRIGMTGPHSTAAESLFRQMTAAFVALDASLVEINPIAVTADGRLVALDAKLTIDDNALFRHTELHGLRDAMARDEGDPIELEAQKHQINYIRMDGDIGVVVNGAGLALATLDMLHDAGGRAANFMDIRTSATSLDIARGYQLILENPAVRAILVNVHGGGMQACDTIAEGIGIALRHSPPRALPTFICMAGNHAEFAKTVLDNTGVRYTAGSNAWDAVQKAVASTKKETHSWRSSLVRKRV